MRVFSGIQATGAKHIGNYIGAMRQYVSTQDRGRRLLLHRRPALDNGRLRPARPARSHARPGRAPLCGRPRPRPLHPLPSEPRDSARGGRLAALGRHRVRTTRPYDPVQGEGRRQGLRLCRALHLSRPDGGRHPALPDGHRPGRGRSAAARRARPRRRQRFNARFGETFKIRAASSPRSAHGSWTCRSRRTRCRQRAAVRRERC